MKVLCNKYFHLPQPYNLEVVKEYGAYPEPMAILDTGEIIVGYADILAKVIELRELQDVN